jgi:hypothetical protein
MDPDPPDSDLEHTAAKDDYVGQIGIIWMFCGSLQQQKIWIK